MCKDICHCQVKTGWEKLVENYLKNLSVYTCSFLFIANVTCFDVFIGEQEISFTLIIKLLNPREF